MPKVKTNAAAKKRFALFKKKLKKRKRNLDHTAIVASANERQVRELLNLR